jgi:hypothetical protein
MPLPAATQHRLRAVKPLAKYRNRFVGNIHRPPRHQYPKRALTHKPDYRDSRHAGNVTSKNPLS